MKVSLIIAMILASLFGVGQVYHSPFNPKVLDVEENGTYEFIVSGHFYGSSSSGASGYPASTLLASIDLLNRTGADFFLSTGDMFVNASEDRERYQLSLFNKLEMPLINAVGNHDMDGGYYEELYGELAFSIELGNDRLIVLDAETHDSDIPEEQLNMLKQAANAMEAGNLRNIYILTHRPIWAEGLEKYKSLFKENTRSFTGTNFNSDVLPQLERMGKHGQVYWFSGSMGGGAPAPIFYDNYSKGIHFVQSAIRDREKDAVLLAKVSPTGVAFEAISLSGGLTRPVSDHGMSFWEKGKGKAKLNYRLIPYYITSTITHRFFWYGVISTLLLVIMIRRAYRRLG